VVWVATLEMALLPWPCLDLLPFQTLEQALTDADDGPRSLHSTCAKLQSVASSLQSWSYASFGSVQAKIKKLERQLRNLRTSPWRANMSTTASNLERRLCELFEREEIMARQRSRVEWLREGDRNTAFFHARALALSVHEHDSCSYPGGWVPM
jgi:hypothetical protein